MKTTQEELIEEAVRDVMSTSHLGSGKEGLRSMMSTAIIHFLCLSKENAPAPNYSPPQKTDKGDN